MMTDPLTATVQMADADEIRIQVMEEELTATVREQFVFIRRIRLSCTTVNVTLAVDMIHGGTRARMYN